MRYHANSSFKPLNELGSAALRMGLKNPLFNESNRVVRFFLTVREEKPYPQNLGYEARNCAISLLCAIAVAASTVPSNQSPVCVSRAASLCPEAGGVFIS